jgi:hypothetical protein
MGAATQLTTFADLYGDLENRVRVASGITATDNQAKRYVNIALQDMHLGFDYRFPWAERSATLLTQPQYTTGTCTIAQGGTSLTGSSTAWNTAGTFGVKNMRSNGKIRVAGSLTPYTIQTVSSDTAATLAQTFAESSQTTASYVYYENEYALAADFLRPIDMQQFSFEISIDLISRNEFRRRYPTNSVPGTPTVACITDLAPSGNTTPVRHVRFERPPSTAMNIPYTYITSYLATTTAGVAQAQMVDDTDEPIIPLRYRHALVYHALYHWYRDKKDDTRSQEAKAEYTDLMLRIASDVEVGGVRPQIRPRTSGYVSGARRPWRGGYGSGYGRAG